MTVRSLAEMPGPSSPRSVLDVNRVPVGVVPSGPGPLSAPFVSGAEVANSAFVLSCGVVAGVHLPPTDPLSGTIGLSVGVTVVGPGPVLTPSPVVSVVSIGSVPSAHSHW